MILLRLGLKLSVTTTREIVRLLTSFSLPPLSLGDPLDLQDTYHMANQYSGLNCPLSCGSLNISDCSPYISRNPASDHRDAIGLLLSTHDYSATDFGFESRLKYKFIRPDFIDFRRGHYLFFHYPAKSKKEQKVINNNLDDNPFS